MAEKSPTCESFVLRGSLVASRVLRIRTRLTTPKKCTLISSKFWFTEGNDKDVEKVDERLQSVGIASSVRAEGGTTSTVPSGDIPSSTTQEEVKRLPGSKVKKKEKQEVIIEKVVHNKRKCITMAKGLDLFGIKLSNDASKKKFATGASVVKVN